jgi:hypothetical protein
MTASEEDEVGKELELPHLPDMLFIHNRLRCSHASGFQLEVRTLIYTSAAAFSDRQDLDLGL